MQKAVVNVARRTARRTAWWRILLGSLAAVSGCIALGGVLVRHEPAFLAAAPATEGAAVERAAAALASATEDSVSVRLGTGGAAAAGRITRSGGGALFSKRSGGAPTIAR